MSYFDQIANIDNDENVPVTGAIEESEPAFEQDWEIDAVDDLDYNPVDEVPKDTRSVFDWFN